MHSINHDFLCGIYQVSIKGIPSMQKRPLGHLVDEHLLCSARLSNWRSSKSAQQQEICVESIDCRDWETGQRPLIFLDHSWLRMSEKAWTMLSQLGLRDGYKTSRLDSVWFVAKPEYYRRADGSEDWGLYLLSLFPTTQIQVEGIRSEFRRLSKPGAVILQPGQAYQRILLTTHLLERKLEDWRLYSTRGPAAALETCANARRNAEAGLRHLVSPQQLALGTRKIKHSYHKTSRH